MSKINDDGLRTRDNGEVDIDYYIEQRRRLQAEKLSNAVVHLGEELKKCLKHEQ